MTTSDLTIPLPQRLRTVSDMINMGEKIAWGSETALMDEAADALDAAMQRDAVFRAALDYISFASCMCPAVINGKDVPEQWQGEIRRAVRHLGEHAEQALQSSEYSNNKEENHE